MTTIREAMSPEVHTVGADETLAEAARKMAEFEVGALPICDAEGEPLGVITDRDIVVKCIAEGGDPNAAFAGEFTQGELSTVEADDELDQALQTMQDDQLRRLLVFDDGKLVGMLSQRDIALAAKPKDAGETVEGISA